MGGAAWGLAHLEMLKVFDDTKISIHTVADTSLGVLIGGQYALQSMPPTGWGVEHYPRSYRSQKTRLEFLRKLVRPANSYIFLSDMATLTRKIFIDGNGLGNPLLSGVCGYVLSIRLVRTFT